MPITREKTSILAFLDQNYSSFIKELRILSTLRKN